MDHYSRRGFIAECACAILAMTSRKAVPENTPKGFHSLFNGKNLDGWKAYPRDAKASSSRGKWVVQDGMIIGAQDPPRVGSYLVTNDAFADFELQIDAWPDWPADTGVYVRSNAEGNTGFQVLIDYRRGGCIGGFYGNKLNQFIAAPYAFTTERDANDKILRLVPTKLAQPPNNPNRHITPLDYAAPIEEFLHTWKVNTWNTFRIRSVGAMPHLTTWINGVKIAELDTATKLASIISPTEVLQRVGRAGHIALEVHSNGPKDWLGMDRWGPGCVCRWRNISIRTL